MGLFKNEQQLNLPILIATFPFLNTVSKHRFGSDLYKDCYLDFTGMSS